MSYILSPASLEIDGAKIMSFWEKNFPDWKLGKFDWFYKKNAYGKAQVWLITHEDSGDVVGSTAIFPRDFIYQGNELKAAITGDFAVDPKHRILGPAIKLQKATIEDSSFSFLYGTPNSKSLAVQRRTGYQRVGFARRYVKVLRLNSYLRRKVNSQFLTSLLSPILNLGYRLFWSKASLDKSRFDYHIADQIDSRMDRLWQKSSSNISNLLLGKRDSSFLNWRAKQCPYLDLKTFTLIEKSTKELCGYVVYHVENNIVHVHDILAIDLGDDYQKLLNAFISAMRLENHDSITVTFCGNHKVIQHLTTAKFLPRKGENNLVAYTPDDLDIYDDEKWYFFDIDND